MPAPGTLLRPGDAATAPNEWRCAALCTLAVVLAVTVADPRLETGFHDD
jgi:hypothetical protein